MTTPSTGHDQPWLPTAGHPAVWMPHATGDDDSRLVVDVLDVWPDAGRRHHTPSALLCEVREPGEGTPVWVCTEQDLLPPAVPQATAEPTEWHEGDATDLGDAVTPPAEEA
ncbi:hypothetical protein GCM10022243_49040 [Saccharothrix violaceirubra]|uniref:Uncharacterized protein n=1 Tax=Saccharothrix violaceirubra TaxID=413306 RepID=A0A7W7WUT3_9PSEU|nr:hypothetical protein [Saccharothrix violaceirubra]MBB4963753.1 hypothetical protein [Saccharothrix violaceirubra]